MMLFPRNIALLDANVLYPAPIRNYGTICKRLFEGEKFSESHHFNLLNDISINIDPELVSAIPDMYQLKQK